MKHLLWIPVILIAFIVGCKKDEKTSTATVTTTAPTGITSNSAQAGGNITSNGGSAISQSGICYATHNNPTVSDSLVNSGNVSTGSFSVSMTNLFSNSTYFVRAYAINGSGTAYGNVDSFTTAKGLPTVVTTAITNNEKLSAQSGGNVTNDGGAPVTGRGICWSTSPNPTIFSAKTSDGTGTGSFVDTLANLSFPSTYYVRAYASNSYGVAYGNEISFSVSSTDVVTDIDGNAYGTVVIGTQTWMASNLRVTHYNNGDSILNGYADNFDWFGNILNSLYVGAYTFPNGDTTTKAQYGLLYNNYALDDARGICPAGWHASTLGDWQTLEFFEGMSAADTALYQSSGRGTIAGNLLVGGSSGLNIQLAGYLLIGGGGNSFVNINTEGLNWTSTPDYTDVRLSNFYQDIAPATYGSSIAQGKSFYYAASVRCLKN